MKTVAFLTAQHVYLAGNCKDRAHDSCVDVISQKLHLAYQFRPPLRACNGRVSEKAPKSVLENVK